MVAFSQVKPNSLKLRALPVFPSRVVAGAGMAVAVANGVYTLSVSFADMEKITSVPDDDLSNIYVGGWDDLNDIFQLYSITELRGLTGPIGPEGMPGDQVSFSYNAQVEAATIVGTVKFLRTAGYAAVGDGGGALYKSVASEPSHPGKIQSLDGGWWEIAETTLGFKHLGAKGDNSTDDTAAIADTFAVSIAQGVPIDDPGGTYLISSATEIPAGLKLRSRIRSKCVFKRKGNSTALGGAILYANARAGIALEGIKIDGNSDNNTVGANSLQLIQCYDFEILNCEFVNSKENSGYGAGIEIIQGADAANSTYSKINGNRFSNNGGTDIYIDRCYNIDICRNYSTGALNGAMIGIGDFSGTTPLVSSTGGNFKVDENVCIGGLIGINISGYADSGAVSVADYKCSNNKVSSCSHYGLALGGDTVLISNNHVTGCGNDTSNGNVLLNARNFTFTDNVINGGYFYGIDAGGAVEGIISGNSIYFNGGGGGNNGTGINLGAATDIEVVGNKFKHNGGASGGACISGGAIDGGGGVTFVNLMARITVRDNEITTENSLQQGIVLSSYGGEQIVVKDNIVRVPSSSRNYAAYVACVDLVATGNTIVESGAQFLQAASANELVLPDVGDEFYITGTTQINRIRTFSQDVYADKVHHCLTSVGGGGYTGNVAVTGSGGGGSGFAATGLMMDGAIRAIRVDNPGVSFTAAPTLIFTGGGGTGVAGTAVIGCRNNYGRTIKLILGGAMTVKHNFGGEGSLNLQGSDVVSTGTSVVTLEGSFNGNWLMISKA